MCDQTPLHYKHGDIVWVKLGVCWWPGEVVDFEKLPEEIREGFKKPRKLPLVTVTFFQEDSYEFVKNLNQIYSYNCNKKDDFIKKGMDLHRGKNYTYMEKFPSDVRTAERKTNGNENILEDPKYGPDQKIDFVSLIFGTPPPKKAKEAKGKRSLKSSPAQKKTPVKTEPNITHPRFTGNDDHQVRMLMQHSNKPEDKKENIYTCQSCDFTSNRIDVIVMHNKYHLQGVYTPIRQIKKTPKRTPTKKPTKRLLKIPSSKTSCIDEDIARLEQGLDLSDEEDEDDYEESEEELPKPKRKQKPKSPKKTAKKPKVEEEKIEKITDIRVNLLAEWDDEEEEEEEESKKEVQSTSILPETEKVDKSCFDFKEDDEIVAEKLPRVVPDKRKSAEPTEDPNLPTAEDDINRTIISNTAESAPLEPEAQKEIENNSKEPDLEAFNAILESTSVVPLPEIPQLLKCEQNFHKTKTIKFPDKGTTTVPDIQNPEVATKLTNPKKRFVKSFEDFEQSLKREKIYDQKSKTEVLIDEKSVEPNNLIPHIEIKVSHDVEVNKLEVNKHIEVNKNVEENKHVEVNESVEVNKHDEANTNEESGNNDTLKENIVKCDLEDPIQLIEKEEGITDVVQETLTKNSNLMDVDVEMESKSLEDKEEKINDKLKEDVEVNSKDDKSSKKLDEQQQILNKKEERNIMETEVHILKGEDEEVQKERNIMEAEVHVLKGKDEEVQEEEKVMEAEVPILKGEDEEVQKQDNIMEAEVHVLKEEEVQKDENTIEAEVGILKGEDGEVQKEENIMEAEVGILKEENEEAQKLNLDEEINSQVIEKEENTDRKNLHKKRAANIKKINKDKDGKKSKKPEDEKKSIKSDFHHLPKKLEEKAEDEKQSKSLEDAVIDECKDVPKNSLQKDDKKLCDKEEPKKFKKLLEDNIKDRKSFGKGKRSTKGKRFSQEHKQDDEESVMKGKGKRFCQEQKEDDEELVKGKGKRFSQEQKQDDEESVKRKGKRFSQEQKQDDEELVKGKGKRFSQEQKQDDEESVKGKGKRFSQEQKQEDEELVKGKGKRFSQEQKQDEEELVKGKGKRFSQDHKQDDEELVMKGKGKRFSQDHKQDDEELVMKRKGKRFSQEHKQDDEESMKIIPENTKSDLIKDDENKLDSIESKEQDPLEKKQELKDSKTEIVEQKEKGNKKELKLKAKKGNKEESEASKCETQKHKVEVPQPQKEKKDSEEDLEKEPRKDRRSSRHLDIKKIDDVLQKKSTKVTKNKKSLQEEPDKDPNQTSCSLNKIIEASQDEIIKEETPKVDHKKHRKGHKETLSEQEDSLRRRSSLRKNSKEEKVVDSDINVEGDQINVKDIVEDKKKGKDSKKSKIEKVQSLHVESEMNLDDNNEERESNKAISRSARGKSQESSSSKDVKKSKDSKTEQDKLDLDEKFRTRRPKKSWDSFEKRMKLRQEREFAERIREENQLKQEEEQRIEAENKLRIQEEEAQKLEEEKLKTQNEEQERGVEEKEKHIKGVEDKTKDELECNLNLEVINTEEKLIGQTEKEQLTEIKSDIEMQVKTVGLKSRRGRRKTKDNKELDENIGYSKEFSDDEKQLPSTSKDKQSESQAAVPKADTETEFIRPLKKSREVFEKHMELRTKREDKSEETFLKKKVKLNDDQKPTESVATITEEIAEKKSETIKLPLEVAKLKTQLMNKLNERGSRKRTKSTDLHLQYKHKNISNTASRKTRIKTESIRRLSLQSQEISIEKSVDKIEVTINKEEETVENALPEDMTVISGKTPELKDLELFSPSVEKKANLTEVIETPAICNVVKPDIILETDTKKGEENTDRIEEIIDVAKEDTERVENMDKDVKELGADVEVLSVENEDNIESNDVENILTVDMKEEVFLETKQVVEIQENSDPIMGSDKVEEISREDFNVDDVKLNIDKIEIFEEPTRKEDVNVESGMETESPTKENIETDSALIDEIKLVENESNEEKIEEVVTDSVITNTVSISPIKECDNVPNITDVGTTNECENVSECADRTLLPDLVESKECAKELDQEIKAEEENIDSSKIVEISVEQTIEEKVVPETSGLKTLAAISELTFDAIPDEKEISIDKNLTVVSASDLGDGQVEIANIPIIEEGTIKAATIVDYTGVDDITIPPKTNEIITDKIVEKEKPPALEEPAKETVESEMAKLTDNKTDPVAAQPHESTSSSKLLEILTDAKIQKPSSSSLPLKLRDKISTPQLKISNPKFATVTPSKSKPKLVIRSSLPSSSKSNKPIIISERIFKPAPQTSEESNMVSVQKVSSKRSFDDIEDAFDTYIIKKPTKKALVEQPSETSVVTTKIVPIKNKTKIINQTIITSTGKVIQPSISKTSNDNVFDIDSMPIVLSDQILTPESIENMPIMIQETPKQIMKKVPQKILNKSVSPVIMKDSTFRSAQPPKTYPKMIKTTTQKVYQSATPTLLKHSPTIISQAGKPGKYVIVPSEASTATGSKYTVGKRIIKKSPAIISGGKVQTVPEPTGNKIMIVTNNQGQQSRVILTPAQQKKMGYQTTVKKTNFKTVVQKDTSKSPNIISQTIINSKGQITTTTNPGVFTSSTSSLSQIKRPRIETKNKIIGQKLLPGGLSQIKSTSGQPRTIIIKNPQGQTVKRIQGTDDALLEQQVAEQIEAINRAATAKSSNFKSVAVKRQTYQKKVIPDNKPKMVLNSIQNKASTIPPLAPISPNKKIESLVPKTTKPPPTPVIQSPVVEKSPEKTETKRTPHQLVIQDALGNQTTITEGQILALPSETVDGQPQSYMLVTLDETGNLTPLNNEALMSLDPNLGGDLSNMVLQIDQGSTEEGIKTDETKEEIVEETKFKEKVEKVEEAPQSEAMQTVACAINNGDSSQQLIITGDPISTQKFLESLTEGNADFANLLANAEGNILIQADGQQILINNDSENQMLFSDSLEGVEGSGNPVFSSPAPKNQDILAAALADTDVFQPEQPKLSPGGPLYPMNVNNVLETSSMSSPIMTPLEVPSTNSKKIDEDAVILTSAPKNVDLPITITDPNISQSVAHQQVTLDLPLAIQDVAVTSADMNSPNFAYSLSTLDEKPFTTSISMPLLTEEPEESPIEKPSEPEELKTELKEEYLLSSGPLCGTINSQMCSSLSEPPPDMFDFTIEQSFEMKQDSTPSEFNSNSTDDSCEIPVQPEIVTKTVSSPKRCFEEDLENEKKKCKFD